MSRLILPLLLFAASLQADPMTLDLWPGAAPGEKGDLPPEADNQKPTDKLVGGKTVMKIGNVSKPTLTLHLAPESSNTGAAVLIAPGGGYNILAWDLEGVEVAQWLNAIGVNGFILKYRVPAKRGGERGMAPQQDAQRALRLIRQNAAQWKIDPRKIGVLGFSAGGHLAAMTCMNHGKKLYDPVDKADELSSRPDFGVLIYAAYLFDNDQPTPGVQVDANTPPIFMAHALDDRVPAVGAAQFLQLLKKHDIPGELHIYANGGHGFGLRRTDEPCTTWPDRCREWMARMKLIPAQ